MTPRGFWSYARGDDEHLDNVLTDLRKRVAGEVSMLLGRDVDMFQDIHDLRTGDRWEKKLRGAISAATFLVPILTPRYFNRDWCQEETLAFLRLAKENGVEPLIFPILFVEDLAPDEDDELRRALGPFQHKEFTNWRFENDPTQKERLLNAFGRDVALRLREAGAAKPPPRRAARPAEAAPASEAAPERERPEPAPPPAIPTLVVDPFPGRGDHSTISAAIDAAEPGTRIRIRPGRYRESLRLSKPLELIGDGERERIVVTTAEGDTLHCDAPMARVSGLTLQREAGGEDYCVWITGGGLELEDCDITSQSLACVAVKGREATPVLRRCVLHDGSRTGLFVIDGARPVVEDCEIAGNALSGVDVNGEGTHAVLRRCTLRDGKETGLNFHDSATGLVEDCEAVGNAHSGVSIKTGADPTLRACRLRNNELGGVWVYEEGRGRIEDCVISDNSGSGVGVDYGGAPVVRGCTISGNGYVAVWVEGAKSGGVFEENDLRGNEHGAWDIAKGAEKNLTRKDNTE